MTLHELFTQRYWPSIARALKPKTLREYERLWQKVLGPALGDYEIRMIGMETVESLHQRIPGATQANRALALLSSVFGYAVERGLLERNPCRGIRRNKEKGREFFYKPAETLKLLTIAIGNPDPRYQYIALELLTGCRPGELLESAPGWRYNSVLRTPDGKTGSRTIYLPKAACVILDGRGENPYRWRDGTDRYFPEGMALRRTWERLCKEAGVPQARLYDLRHTFASAALAAGQSLDVIGRMLGHRKAQTTLRYSHLAPDVGLEGAAAAAARMGAK